MIRKANKMKILQLCYKMPYPVRDGGSYAVYHSSLALLKMNEEVKVIAINTPKEWVDIEDIPFIYREQSRFEAVVVDTRIQAFKAFSNLFSRESYFVERFRSEALAERLTELLVNESFDIIFLEHLYLCVYLHLFRKHSRAKVILRAQNVENQLWYRVLSKKKNPLVRAFLRINTRKLEKFERQVTGMVDGIIAISPGDRQCFESWHPAARVINIPPGVVLKDPEHDHNQVADAIFYHLGSMDWMPNQQGIQWFIRDILPAIRKQVPNFRFHIAGKKMPAWLYDLKSPQVIVDGEVEDAHQYQQDKSVMIVPLISGGGIRVKIIEAMAMGKVVISTTIGAEGIPYTPGKDILIANRPEEFVMHIQKCMESMDYRLEIGRNARDLARRTFDIEAISRQVHSFFQELISIE